MTTATRAALAAALNTLTADFVPWASSPLPQVGAKLTGADAQQLGTIAAATPNLSDALAARVTAVLTATDQLLLATAAAGQGTDAGLNGAVYAAAKALRAAVQAGVTDALQYAGSEPVTTTIATITDPANFATFYLMVGRDADALVAPGDSAGNPVCLLLLTNPSAGADAFTTASNASTYNSPLDSVGGGQTFNDFVGFPGQGNPTPAQTVIGAPTLPATLPVGSPVDLTPYSSTGESIAIASSDPTIFEICNTIGLQGSAVAGQAVVRGQGLKPGTVTVTWTNDPLYWSAIGAAPPAPGSAYAKVQQTVTITASGATPTPQCGDAIGGGSKGEAPLGTTAPLLVNPDGPQGGNVQGVLNDQGQETDPFGFDSADTSPTIDASGGTAGTPGAQGAQTTAGAGSAPPDTTGNLSQGAGGTPSTPSTTTLLIGAGVALALLWLLFGGKAARGA